MEKCQPQNAARDSAPQRAARRATLRLRQINLLKELISVDREIRELTGQTPPASATDRCKCGREFKFYTEFMLHIAEEANPFAHHDPLSPPRKVRCRNCNAMFIHEIPADHECDLNRITYIIGKGKAAFNVTDFD